MRKWMVEARDQKKLTQQQVAEKIGVTRQLISAIENGTASPGVPVAQAIGEILEVPWVQFYEKKEATIS